MAHKPTAIVGVGQTKHRTARKDVSLAGLVRLGDLARPGVERVQRRPRMRRRAPVRRFAPDSRPTGTRSQGRRRRPGAPKAILDGGCRSATRAAAHT